MWQSCILRPLYAVHWFPLVILFVLSVSHLISALCLFYKFAWPFSLISFNLKVIHCAPSSSVMAHVLTLHSEKLDMFSFFIVLAHFLMHEWSCILINAPVSPKVWSDVAHFIFVNILSCWILYHFLLTFWFHFHCAWIAHLSVFLSS